MRYSLFSLFVLLSIAVFSLSCGKDSDNKPSKEELEKSSKVDILFLRNSSAYDEPTPRMIASVDDWNVIEITNPDNPKMGIFHMIDCRMEMGYVICATDSTAIICYATSSYTTPYRRAIMISSTSEGIHFSLCNINWKTGAYAIEKEALIEKTETRSSSSHELDFVREEIDKMLDKIQYVTDRIGWASSIAELPVGAIADVWSKVVIPIAKYRIWQDDPERLEIIRDEYMKGEAESVIVNLFLTRDAQRAWYAFRLTGVMDNVKQYAGSLWDMVGPDVNDEDIPEVNKDDSPHVWIRNLSDIARFSQPLQEEFVDITNKPKYRLSVDIVQIGVTEVVVSGSYDLNDGYETGVSQMGFVIQEEGGSERTIEAWNLYETCISGLEPGKKYRVWAFMNTFFGSHTSAAVEFTTDGLFNLSPYELLFTEEGGSQDVFVEIGEGMSWDITDHPDWCSISKKNDYFTINAKPANERRIGVVNAVAKLREGGSITKTVTVEQTVQNRWDGTKWEFKGSVNAYGDMAYIGAIKIADITNFGIEIREVKNNDYFLSGDMAGMEKGSRIYCDEENRLIWSQSQTISEAGVSMNITTKITFVRTGKDSASGDIEGSASVNVPGFNTVKISLNGRFNGFRK